MAENDIVAFKELASGGFVERVLTPADISAAAATHASTHHTGGSDALTPANIGAAPAITEIEVPNSGTSTTTLTTSQLPARVILFLGDGSEPSATINLPTPSVRESGLTASIKVEIEDSSYSSCFITVVHDAVTLLNNAELDAVENSIDFLWDGYAWTYSSSLDLRSYPNRVLRLPAASGTLALTQSADNVFRVVGSSDATKKVAFEVDGLTTGTTRTLTAPDASGTIALTGQLTDTQIFTANGTWTKPAGAKMVHYLLIGGGGGGGAGRRSLQGNSLSGGGGGAGGGITAGYVDPAFLGSTESITVGAGGTGAADSADNTNGASGTAGGDSSLGSFVKAKGGAAGGGGSSTAGAAGAATTLASLFYGTNSSTQAGGIGSPNSATAGATAAASLFLPSGGGGGGGRHSSVNTLGGKGGDIGQTNTGVTAAPAIASDTNGPAGIRSQSSWAGTGGGGGSNGTDTGFQGGNGGLYGGGGGGGSGAINTTGGNNKGGDGGAGIVIITTYF